jgi:hypothetical protein
VNSSIENISESRLNRFFSVVFISQRMKRKSANGLFVLCSLFFDQVSFLLFQGGGQFRKINKLPENASERNRMLILALPTMLTHV